MRKTSSLCLPVFLASIMTILSCTRSEPERPNIIFIMSDDHAYQAISAYSDRLISTPNIDRIANEGMIFTNACVSNSICAPSRAVIFTGKHSHINGKIDNRFPFDTSQVTFPQLLQEAGYQTAIFGKLHFGNKPRGFDQFKILPGQGQYYNPDFITKDSGRVKIEGYVTDIITDLTLDWLDRERDSDKPFFLAYWHKAPHREWFPDEKHYKEFLKKEFPEPETLHDNYEGRGSAAREAEMNLQKHMSWVGDSKIRPDVLADMGFNDPDGRLEKGYRRRITDRMTEEQREAWEREYSSVNEHFRENYPSMSDKEKMQWRYQRYMQDYLACIASVDDNVGRLLNYLDEAGLSENTMIVYTSDQGFYLGEHGWFDKRFIYNESFKTPLLVKWPGVIDEGVLDDRMVQNLDFAQTILDVARVEAPDEMQGESLVPLFMGESEKWKREAVYYHYYEYPAVHMVKRHYGIVTREYKLAHFYYDVDEWELYDRLKDTFEINNVYNNPEYAEVVTELKDKLTELREKYGDSEELDSLFIEKYKK